MGEEDWYILVPWWCYIGAFQYVIPEVVRGSVGVPFTARALPDQSPQITTSKRERAAVTLSQPRTTKTHAFTCTLGQTLQRSMLNFARCSLVQFGN